MWKRKREENIVAQKYGTLEKKISIKLFDVKFNSCNVK